MSLKVFHVIFIVCSILLLLGFGYWALTNYLQNHEASYLTTAIGSVILAVGLVIYEINFLKKVKS